VSEIYRTFELVNDRGFVTRSGEPRQTPTPLAEGPASRVPPRQGRSRLQGLSMPLQCRRAYRATRLLGYIFRSNLN